MKVWPQIDLYDSTINSREYEHCYVMKKEYRKTNRGFLLLDPPQLTAPLTNDREIETVVSSPISSLHMSVRYLITASWDSKIRIYDYWA